MDLLIEFAKIGLGIACVIKELVQKELDSGMLVEIPLDIPIHRRDHRLRLSPGQPGHGPKTFLEFLYSIFRTYNSLQRILPIILHI